MRSYSSMPPATNFRYETNAPDVANQFNGAIFDQNAITRTSNYTFNSSTVSVNQPFPPFSGGSMGTGGLTLSHNSSQLLDITKKFSHITNSEVTYDKFSFTHGDLVFFLSPDVLWNDKLENIPMTVASLNDFIEQNHKNVKTSTDVDYIRKAFQDGVIDAFGGGLGNFAGSDRDEKYKFQYLLNDPAAVYQMIKFYGVFGNGLAETVSMGKVFSGLNEDINSSNSGEKRKYMEMLYGGSKKMPTNVQPILNMQKKVVSESIILRGDSYFSQSGVTVDPVRFGTENDKRHYYGKNKPVEKGELYFRVSKRTDGAWKGVKDAPCQVEICLAHHYEPEWDDEMRRLTKKIGLIDYYTSTTEHSDNIYDLRGHILVNQ